MPRLFPIQQVSTNTALVAHEHITAVGTSARGPAALAVKERTQGAPQIITNGRWNESTLQPQIELEARLTASTCAGTRVLGRSER